MKSTAVVLLTCFALAANTLDAAPKAVIVGDRHLDAGEVEPSEILNYEFVLKNGGDETLSIVDLAPTCYCTTAKTNLWDIPPGKTATIAVRIDPSDFVGDINKGVEITTNDPKKEYLMVDVDINVRPGIAVLPPELDFGDVPPEGTKSQKVDIKVSRERDFAVTKITSEAAFLEMAHDPLDLEDRHGASVYVKVLPGAPAGDFEAVVAVHTSDKSRPTIEIPVRGRGPGGLSASPARILFEAKPVGAEVGSFEVSGGQNLQVSSSSEHLLAELLPDSEGGFVVKLKLTDTARAGRLLAKVTVSTTDGSQPELTVPVMGIVR